MTKREKSVLYILATTIVCLTAILLAQHFKMGLVIQPTIAEVSAIPIEGEEEVVSLCQIELDAIPTPILRSFLAYRWTLCVDDGFLAEYSERTNTLCTGATAYHEKKIYISDPCSITHEFGHYLEGALGFPECHNTLYEQEAQAAEAVLGVYATTNSREYFAEYFEFWIAHEPDTEQRITLQTLSPNTYQYFAALEGNNWGLATAKVVLWFNGREIPLITASERS